MNNLTIKNLNKQKQFYQKQLNQTLEDEKHYIEVLKEINLEISKR